jgi:hypothetical protein
MSADGWRVRLQQAWAEIVCVAAWISAFVFTTLDRPRAVIPCLLVVIIITTSRPKSPSLQKNQAIVTASIEPSADIREAARSMTEIRVALIASGYTPEQASRQIADMIAASQGGAS